MISKRVNMILPMGERFTVILPATSVETSENHYLRMTPDDAMITEGIIENSKLPVLRLPGNSLSRAELTALRLMGKVQ